MTAIHRDRFFSVCRCIEDVKSAKIDPTGTAPIRRQFFSALAIKWRRVRITVRAGILDQDVLGLGSVKAAAARAATSGGSTKIQIFQRWMDTILATMVADDGQAAEPYIRKAYDDGFALGQRMADRKVVSTKEADKVAAIAALAHVELQGIAEAVSQNAVRAVANGLLNNSSRNKILTLINKAIDSIGVTRTKTMIELLVVKAFGDATLDAYEAAGVEFVGLLPESVAAKGVKDAMTTDLRQRRSGPGSRVPRTQVPSARTIRRIKAAERQLSAIPWVNVQTAEDDRVCEICESISESGPYKINAARSLIPAHPYCRCIFIPARKPPGYVEED